MIITVTPNTGIDRVIFVENFAWGTTLRALRAVWGMGGKATDASLVLGELGEPNLATGFAAGETGRRMVAMLQKREVTRCDFVWVEGETRTNYVLIDSATRQQSTITVDGLRVGPQHLSELRSKIAALLAQASCLVLGGSVPAGVPPSLYAELIGEAKGAKVPTILDASGEPLRLGAAAGPTVLKPNIAELETLTGRPLSSEREILEAARGLLRAGTALVVVTAGARGAWAITGTAAFYAPPLPIEPVNTAGAGDALVAGIAVGIARGWPWEEGIRLGLAAAAAVCLTPGTAICARSQVEQFLGQVMLQRVAG